MPAQESQAVDLSTIPSDVRIALISAASQLTLEAVKHNQGGDSGLYNSNSKQPNAVPNPEIVIANFYINVLAYLTTYVRA